MCDLNGHINNSLYLDIACDALPQEVVEAAPLSFASIKYHREVPMGQTVQVFYAPRETAGMCWAGGRSTQPLSAIWNSEALSQNLYKNNYKEITKNYCKSPSKELQYGYRKGKTLLDHEIFFFLFLEYRVSAIPPPAVLLHSCRPTPHRRYSASCAKEPVWFRTGFCVRKSGEIGPQRGKV